MKKFDPPRNPNFRKKSKILTFFGLFQKIDFSKKSIFFDFFYFWLAFGDLLDLRLGVSLSLYGTVKSPKIKNFEKGKVENFSELGPSKVGHFFGVFF